MVLREPGDHSSNLDFRHVQLACLGYNTKEINSNAHYIKALFGCQIIFSKGVQQLKIPRQNRLTQGGASVIIHSRQLNIENTVIRNSKLSSDSREPLGGAKRQSGRAELAFELRAESNF